MEASRNRMREARDLVQVEFFGLQAVHSVKRNFQKLAERIGPNNNRNRA